MKISAAGSSAFIRHHQSGFTLVELMAVVAIIGVASAAVVLAMPDPRGDLRRDAERLAARASAARDAAIIEARPTALILGPAGYGFSRRQGGRWTPISQKPLAQQRWGDGVTADVSPSARIVFDSTGLIDPATVTLARDGVAVRVLFETNGSIDVR